MFRGKTIQMREIETDIEITSKRERGIESEREGKDRERWKEERRERERTEIERREERGTKER